MVRVATQAVETGKRPAENQSKKESQSGKSKKSKRTTIAKDMGGTR